MARTNKNQNKRYLKKMKPGDRMKLASGDEVVIVGGKAELVISTFKPPEMSFKKQRDAAKLLTDPPQNS